jgi:phage terminase large subunit-like protein
MASDEALLREQEKATGMKPTREQLASMSKEEKLRLLELIEEKKRRAKDARPPFKPHPGQMKVIKSPALEKYLFPGNGYGKTALLVNELHWTATGYNPVLDTHSPVPAKICLVVATSKDIDEVVTEYRRWYPLGEDQLHKRGKPHYSEFSYGTGSTVTILTHEVNPLSLEGSQWTHLFLNEPPPKAVYTALYRGLRIKGRPGRVLLAGTPIAASWLRTDIYEPWKDGKLPHVECFTGKSVENAANLEDGYIERFAANLTDKEKAIRLEGQFFDMDGLALAHLLDPHVHLVPNDTPWDRDNPCVVVIDPHPSKAHNAVMLGVDRDEGQYVVEEWKEKATARQFMEKLIAKGWFDHYRVLDIVADSLGSADTTSGEGFRSFIEVCNDVLKKAGYNLRVRATTYDEKSDEDFIERIRDTLSIPPEPNNFGQRLPKLRFYERCRGSYYDVRTVQWYEDRTIKENKPKLDIRQKDFLSCIKYGLATNLFYSKPRRMKPHYRSKPVYGMELPAKRTANDARLALAGGKKPSRRFYGLKPRGYKAAEDDEDDF